MEQVNKMNEQSAIGEESLAITAGMQGRVGDEANRNLRAALWNGAARVGSLAMVKCNSLEDVQRAVRHAADRGWPVSVLGGGHDWAARAACTGGVKLDLRRMNSVEPDVGLGTVELGGGTLVNDVLSHLPDDRVVVTGTISTVGMAGLTLGVALASSTAASAWRWTR